MRLRESGGSINSWHWNGLTSYNYSTSHSKTGYSHRMQLEFKTTLLANEPIAITIGNFDGIHKGHQRLMHELAKTARSLQSKPVMVTFSPHTLTVVRPDIDVRYLTTLEEKLELAQRYGAMEGNIVVYFTL